MDLTVPTEAVTICIGVLKMLETQIGSIKRTLTRISLNCRQKTKPILEKFIGSSQPIRNLFY
jgi:hypothetical protein